MSYDEDQIKAYFQHVRFDPPSGLLESDPLCFVASLQAHQIAHVPFESLSLHYSKQRLLSLDLQDLFEKIVVRGRGGYCMELNALFAAVLRSLGIRLFSAGGRVKHERGWTGLEHMVNVVTLGTCRYLVDVGFGSNGPMQPILLESGYEFTQIAPVKGKMEYTSLPEHSDPSQRVWLYSTRRPSGDETWQPAYCFLDAELFPADFEGLNMAPMLRPTSLFVQQVIAVRGILDGGHEEQDGSRRRIIGVVTLMSGTVRRNIEGHREILESLTTEEGRIRALERWFDVSLSETERDGIRGLASELRS